MKKLNKGVGFNPAPLFLLFESMILSIVKKIKKIFKKSVDILVQV